MARETNPGPINVVAENTAGLLESPRNRLLAKAAVFAGALALVGGAESGNPPASQVPSVPMRAISSAYGNVAPPKWTGVLEDAAKQPSEPAAIQKMQLLSGLVQARDAQPSTVYVKESIWASPGQTGPSEEDFANLENSIKAAQANNYNVCLAVWPYTWGEGKDRSLPPLEPSKQWQYTTLLATLDGRLKKDFGTKPGEQPPVSCWFIGNEPNNPDFWRPQFNPDGTDAAAAAYEHLLARSYDALKKISPDYVVIGAELASHGGDDPNGKRKSHSPEAFIRDMGIAYRDSGRTKPIMDVFGYHPYGLSSAESPAVIHPDSTTIGVADYPRLVSDLGKAFDGSAQAGSKLPVLYSEYGVESIIPPAQQYRYKHAESAGAGAVDEKTQGEYYGLYTRMAACQPNVIGAFIFHTLDEKNKKGGWQSGPNYSDGSPKSSQPAIGRSMQTLNDGGTKCS